MKLLMINILLLAVSVGMLGAESVKISQTMEKPVIDGNLSDLCWKGGEPVRLINELGSSHKTIPETAVKIVFDTQYLYIAFKCSRPMSAQINHDKQGNMVMPEERVEIFCDPGVSGKKYFHFTLSSNASRRQQMVDAGNKSSNWNTSWLSAASYTEEGWNAEAAIPMEIFAIGGDLKNFRVNFCRTAFVDGKECLTSWQPAIRSFHEPENFGNVLGLWNIVENVRIDSNTGKNCYTVDAVFTPPSEENNLHIEAFDTAAGKTTPCGKRIIDRRRKQTYTVPADNLTAAREFKLELYNAKNKNKLQTVILAFNPSKDTVLLLPGKSYYSAEEEAAVIIESKVLLPQGSYVTIKDASGELPEARTAIKDSVFTVPLKVLKTGNNRLQAEIFSPQDNKLFAGSVELIKREPRPGHEVKTDRVNGIVEVNGTPFFPLGLTVAEKKDYLPLMQKLSAHNFNTAVNWLFTENDLKAIIQGYKTAEKYNIMIIDRIYGYNDKKLNDRNGAASFPDDFKRNLPGILAAVAEIKDLKNLLGYATFDEPSSRHEVPGKTLYDNINRIDGYHPVWCNYNRTPGMLEATDWYDIISRDIYWNPGDGGVGHNSPDTIAPRAVNMYRKAAEIHEPMWVMLQTSRVASGRRRILLPQEIYCQAYCAVINGAKGIIYFSEPLMQHVDSWDALKNINHQIKTLSPALLNRPVKQNINISIFNDSQKTENNEPDLQAAVFMRPDGGNILLLTNVRYYPINAIIKIPGLKQAVRLFEKHQFDGECINEAIEPCGVRAYILDGTLTEPVNVDIRTQAFPDRIILPLDKIPRTGMSDKINILPNPGFETTTVQNWPDYFTCGAKSGYLDVGGSRQKWGTDSKDVFEGKKCLKIELAAGEDNMLASYHCPPYSTDNYVFSAWIKADRPSMSARFFAFGKKHDPFKLSTEWKRYYIVTALPSSPTRTDGIAISFDGEGTVLVDAVQLEKGTVPSAFTSNDR